MRMQRPFFPTAICCRLKTFQTTLTSSPNYFSLGPSWNVGIIPLSSQSWRNSHPGACPWVQELHSGVQKQWVSTTRCEPSLPAQINCLGEQTTLPVTWRAPTAPQEEGPLPLHGLMSMICFHPGPVWMWDEEKCKALVLAGQVVPPLLPTCPEVFVCHLSTPGQGWNPRPRTALAFCCPGPSAPISCFSLSQYFSPTVATFLHGLGDGE